ncbi:MAG: PEP-CTERM sorting domain-containing protein [Verrucomicrobiota bacterium]
MNRSIRFAFAVAILLMAVPGARALTYQLDGWPPAGTTQYEIFNNSVGTETEDCWLANSFQVAPGGETINSLTFALGNANPSVTTLTLQVTVALYTGTSLTNPAGLVRIIPATNTVTLTNATTGSLQTINFATPTVLSAGQIFYAAILVRGVNGSTFPFASDFFTPGPSPTNQMRSFFDVGPTQGGSYNLDNTGNATLLGGVHPVLGGSAQDAANLVLRVNASAVPEPSSIALLGLGVMVVARRLLRKRA